MIAERKMVTDQYAGHVARITSDWTAALAEEPFDAILVHAGSEIISFMDDYHYAFRCNPHLQAWAPLTTQHDSALLFRPGETPVLYYYQPDDYWYLPPSDPEGWWAAHFDVRTVTSAEAWQDALKIKNLAVIGDAPVLKGLVAGSHLNPERLINRLHLARTRKSRYELDCMREANRVAACAHLAAERAFRDGRSEFEIHLEYIRVTGQTDTQLPYGNIIALNEHGAVLHYQQQDRARVSARSFLIDAGATQQGYASDITRTYSRQFDPFAELIKRMDMVQQALANAVRPGLDYRELHLDAHRAIAGVLADMHIIKCEPETAVETGLSSVFYPHGLGHFIGLQTHDVAGLIADADGTPIPRPEGHPFLRLTRTLEEGNVVTIEPGLYFIEPLLRRWRREGDVGLIDWDKVEQFTPYGGVRIEDDVAVTETGCENFTRPAFAAMAG